MYMSGLLDGVWAQLIERFEETLLSLNRHEQHSTSLEVGRISPQLAQVEGKNLLVVIQNMMLPCARVFWSLKLEAS